MSEPRRLLLDDEASDFTKDLVRSWDHVRPTDEGKDRTLAALGVAGVASTAIVTGTTAGTLAPKAVAGAAWLKWIAVASVVAGVAAVGAFASSRPDRAAAPGQAALSGSPTLEPSAPPELAAPLPSAPPAPSVVAAPLVITPSALPNAPTPRAELPRAAPTPSLDEQLAALDRARSALDEGDSSRAQSLVDDYETHYRDGAFLQEAEVLRIQALLKRGDRAGAERASQRFLAAFPRSPHAARVRSLLAAPR